MPDNPIVEWLRNSVRDISKMPVKGIVLVAITDNGDSYTNYYQISMADKLLVSGLIQQDSTLDMLAANGFIQYEDDEENEEEDAIGEEKE